MENETGTKSRIVNVDREEAGYNISWASVIAGVVTFIAVLLTLSLVGSAIGFGIADPTSANPLDGVGTGVLIWTVVAFVLSLGAAGFMAGITSRRMGVVHGFLTWATSVITLLVMLSFLTINAFSAIGSTVGSVVSMTGQGVETVVQGSTELITKGFDNVVGEMGDVDTAELQTQVTEILKDTDVPELQPNYINDQLKEASTEIANAGKEIVLNPENAEGIIQDTLDSLAERATTIADAADRDAIANAVNKNTDLTQEEAEQATDNIYQGLQEASAEAEMQLQMASQRIEETRVEIDQTIEEARVKADETADTTSQASIWGFVGLLLGMFFTSATGYWGSNFAATHDEERM